MAVSIPQKRKYLKTIYDIQKTFGSDFGDVSRNFSFGIKPSETERLKLEIWYTQVISAKEELYKEVFEDYKSRPYTYLANSFKYETLFKGGELNGRIKANRNLIKTCSTIEGLSMEINGSIRSFITIHKRIYEDNISEISKIKKHCQKIKSI
jgi:hypothetical protein